MYRLRYLDGALKDLHAIKKHIVNESHSEDIALGFLKLLLRRCEWLAIFPGKPGRLRPDLATGIYSFPHDNCIICFQYEDNELQIVTITERHRDLEALFENEQ